MSQLTKAEAAALTAIAGAIESNEQAIETELGTFTVKIEGEVVTIEGDAVAKMNPVFRGLVQGALSALNPIVFNEIPTLEAQGLGWLVAALKAEAAKLNAAP
jgi:hypothetical protein